VFSATWSSPEFLSTSSSRLKSSTIAANTTAGSSLAGWYEFNSNTYEYSVFNGSTWSTKATLAGDATVERLIITLSNPNGQAIAVWVEQPVDNEINLKKFNLPSDTPLAPAATATSTADIINSIDIAIDGNGDGLLVWEQDSGTKIILGSRYNYSTNTWTATNPLSNGLTDATSPRVELDASKNAIATWIQNDGSNDRVVASTLPSGGSSWTASTTISSSSVDASNLELAVNSSGFAVAIWLEGSVVKSKIYVGSTWTTTTFPGTAAATYCEVGVDSSGNSIAVWEESAAVYAAKLPSGSTSWIQYASPLSGSDTLSNSLRLGVNDSGDAVAMWMSGTDPYDLQATTYSSASSSWDLPVAVIDSGLYSPETGNARKNIPINAGGDIVAIWSYSNIIASDYTVASSMLEAPTPTPTPDEPSSNDLTTILIAQEVETQATQALNESILNTLQEVTATGITGVTSGTFPDTVNPYIIDSVTPYTTDIQLPPLWCN